jgi:ketopantoate hydroxymethyltransferase
MPKKQFLVLYRSDMEAMKKMMAEASAEDRKKGTEAWMNWMRAHQADLADMGAPVGKNMSVTANGSTDSSNDIGGYSVIQAESKDAAAKILSDSPHLQMKGASIDLMEIIPVGAN